MIYTLEDFDQMLDETHEPVNIAGSIFSASDILKNCDPIAYNEYATDYLTIMEEEYLNNGEEE
jgi:hypothetical protein